MSQLLEASKDQSSISASPIFPHYFLTRSNSFRPVDLRSHISDSQKTTSMLNQETALVIFDRSLIRSVIMVPF